MNLLQNMISLSTNYIVDGGLVIGFLLVLLESFVPILPLSVFVALNVNSFGFFGGVILSWIATSIGSIICYKFFYLIDYKHIKFFDNKIFMMISKFNSISFTRLVLLLTLPFTPSFLINLLSGITKMSFEKFLFSVIIGKCFSIIFWGYIGKSLINNITDLYSIIYIIITIIMAYLISKIISKKLQIE